MPKQKIQFCIECREETPYRIHLVSYNKRIKEKEYKFIHALMEEVFPERSSFEL